MKNTILVLTTLIMGITLMSGIIDLNDLFNYEDQNTPTYVTEDNSPADNELTNAGATLGRVLFYDKHLSTDNSIACASCHLQEFAFGDSALVSVGVNGVTGRHSMRLINARYSEEVRAFWDERSPTFEHQATQPVQDHVEMGYSGENGDPDINVLISKLDTISYYEPLFELVYGDDVITEERIQNALAQFVRSIESFDSKFDEGRAMVATSNVDFPNFTTQENEGKDLFMNVPPQGGAGCDRCHGEPEFTMIPNCDNNGVTGVANDPLDTDTEVTKAPSLRDLVNPQGIVNGPLMHDGSLVTLMDVVDHYNDLVEVPGTNLDFRLSGEMHDLDLTSDQKDAIVAFLHTLTGVEVYTAPQWSNPFDERGEISITELTSVAENINSRFELNVYPNPAQDQLSIAVNQGNYVVTVLTVNGKIVRSFTIKGNHTEDISSLPAGVFMVKITDTDSHVTLNRRIVKQ